MDVSDIMAFKPPPTPKRLISTADPAILSEDITENASDNFEVLARKRKLAVLRAKAIAAKAEEEAKLHQLEQEKKKRKLEENTSRRSRPELSMTDIAKLVDNSEQFDILDAASVKRQMLLFEKRCLKNQELRIKFSDEPHKFLEAELELYDTLSELRNLATVPHLYPVLVDLGCVQSILGLLAHDNTDIAVATVNILEEMTDVDTLNESEEGAEIFIDSLLEHQILNLLATNIARLDENVREEADGVHNTLALIENLLEFRPEISAQVASAGFLTWIVNKVKVKNPFDPNKLYASEILSILLQDCPENRNLFGEIGALDSLLQQLAYYRRHEPGSVEEVELMENLFNSLCSLMMEEENREKFLAAEGLQLMNLMLKEKKKSRGGALKVLSHALSGSAGSVLCNKFVDILGLKIIFPLFMKTPSKVKRAGISSEEHEEYVLSILSSLFINLKESDENVKLRERLFSKFVESDHAKVDRLVELHFKYHEKLVETGKVLSREVLEWEGTEEEIEEEMYMKRLDGGLYQLQQIDYMLLKLCCKGATSIKPRVQQGLAVRGEDLSRVCEVVKMLSQDQEEESEIEELLSLV